MITLQESAFNEDFIPTRFGHLVGLKRKLSRLTKAISRGHIPRKVNFTGPTGVGKSTVARILAAVALCTQRQLGTYEPCGECSRCKAVFAQESVYFEEYGAGQLDDEFFLDIKFELRHSDKVIFIDELQDASKQNQNRLRLAINHPRALVIVATTHRHQVDPALLNRFRSYEFELKRPMPPEVASSWRIEFELLGLPQPEEQLLLQAATALNCEMRRCAEFPRQVLVENEGNLTQEYLCDLFESQPDDAGVPISEDFESEV